MKQTDIAVVGAGVVGLATAYQITQAHPQLSVTVIDKEPEVARHQTGHNSGVLHSGIYYRPGSLKATNCRAGKLAMVQFCQEQEIDFELCGKVIVAVDESEVPTLQNILERGQANQVSCELIDSDRLKELEPHVNGVKAIHVPEAGIVNYKKVCQKLAELVQQNPANHLSLGNPVKKITRHKDRAVVTTLKEEWESRLIINCGGLHCDRISKLGKLPPNTKIVPFRGEYFELRDDRRHLCRNLIYPVPDPKFPFLGVHFTRMIDGSVECGPNAVLAFAREGYRKQDINLRDLAESLTYPGFIRLALKHFKMGMGELHRSFSKQAFVKALQRLLPEIQADDLKAAPAGVRAQAVQSNGSLVDDFLIEEDETMISVLNAPSPAATASLNIGKVITDRISHRFS